jgi:hypothetical protein
MALPIHRSPAAGAGGPGAIRPGFSRPDIRRRLGLATAGPWSARPGEDGWRVEDPAGSLIAFVPEIAGEARARADARLIAAARPDLLALLSALEGAPADLESVAALREVAYRIQAATEGPWAWRWAPGRFRIYSWTAQGVVALVPANGHERRVRDAEFIAAARTDLADLLARARRRGLLPWR